MSLFATINAAASARGVHFLVIGAHAVIEHGFNRGTEDADILVSKDDRQQWVEIAAGMGYSLRHDGGTFLQFESQVPTQWPLDVMLVPAETLDRLRQAAKPAVLDGTALAVPSLEHLLALKIHALKHGKGLRVLKDTTDVVELLRVNRVDPRSPWLQALFDKHGRPESYERILKLLS